MNEKEALAYIHHFGKFVDTPGLRRMGYLMNALGNPHKSLKCIHIAGTNGKGSTAAMLASVLRQAGYRVGLYTSPYIYDFRERMQIDGALIPKEDLAKLVEEVKEHAEELNNEGQKLAEFEFITAMAFLWFKRQDCDIVVLETGLGGRLDATNIIENPLVTILTSISLDHMKILGNTVEEIAKEKCGIIKGNCPVVSYPLQVPSVEHLIKSVAKEKQAAYIVPTLGALESVAYTIEGSAITYKAIDYLIPFLGEHQVMNTLMVLETIGVLEDLGFPITIDAVKAGICATKWPARIQVISKNPIIIIDGSHNISGIEALSKSLKYLVKDKVRLIFGMLVDKDYQGALQIISPLCKKISLVTPSHLGAAKGEDLLYIAKDYCQDVIVYESIHEAIVAEKSACKEEEVLVICGSLYMMQEVKEVLDKMN